MAIKKIDKWVTETGMECDSPEEAHLWDVIDRHNDDLEGLVTELDQMKVSGHNRTDYMRLLIEHRCDILLFLNDFINGPKYTENG